MPGGEPTEIIAAVYDAIAGDQPPGAAWDSVARLIEDRFGGVWMLSLEDGATGTAKLAAAPSLADNFRRAYETLHAGNSPWIKALRHARHPATATDAEAATAGPAALTASAFYTDWMKPQRFRHTIASDVYRDGTDMLVLKTLLPPETPPSDALVALHDQLRPHISRAAAIYRMDRDRRAALQAAEAALEGLSVAVFLVKCRDASVTFMNKAAARLGAAGDGLTIDASGRLTAAESGATSILRGLITSHGDPTTTGGVATGRSSAMRLPRPSGARDLHLLVTPVERAADGVLSLPTATVFITDPAHPPSISAPRLRELHGLTAAEARVTAALARGGSIGETAQDLGIADATVRHHLKQAFAKTGTHRQADLVRLILADPLMHGGAAD